MAGNQSHDLLLDEHVAGIFLRRNFAIFNIIGFFSLNYMECMIMLKAGRQGYGIPCNIIIQTLSAAKTVRKEQKKFLYEILPEKVLVRDYLASLNSQDVSGKPST